MYNNVLYAELMTPQFIENFKKQFKTGIEECPRCCYADLGDKEFYNDGTTQYVQSYCNNCGLEWTEVSELARIICINDTVSWALEEVKTGDTWEVDAFKKRRPASSPILLSTQDFEIYRNLEEVDESKGGKHETNMEGLQLSLGL